MKFIQDNLQYPETSKQNKINGTVYVKFIIEADSTISNVTILKGFESNCDAEAIRVIKSMPKWIPGKSNDKAVRVYYVLPVKFCF